MHKLCSIIETLKGVSSNFNSYALIHFILHLTNVPNPTRIVIIDQQKPETWCRLFETHQTLGFVQKSSGLHEREHPFLYVVSPSCTG